MNSIRRSILQDDIITIDEIKMILENYRIGKKPLAKLLGWGETTIIRYIEGDIPTKEYSNKLKVILDDAEYFYELLLSKKDTLTNVAFRKSEMAVLSTIMASKINVVAYYLVNKCNGEFSPSYIQFLLYYIQAFSLAFYNKEMFCEEYEVNSSFKPYPKLYDSMIRSGVHTIEIRKDYLTTQDKELIDSIYDSFIWYGPKALSAMLSFERSKMNTTSHFNQQIIDKETIKGLFKEIIQRYHISNLKDIRKYPNKRMFEISTSA